ncbi:hypothetical protein Tco_0806393, partial [Tanacetum coccineum]
MRVRLQKDHLIPNPYPLLQTDPSPRPSPSIVVPDSNPDGFGGNHGGQSSNDISLSENEDGQEAKERSQTTYHTLQILDEEYCTEDNIGKEDFSKEKGDLPFDDLDDDAMDYIETEDAQDEGRTSSVVLEEKESTDKEVWRYRQYKSSTDRQGEGTADQNEGKNATQIAPTTTSTPTSTRSILTLRPLPKINLKDKGKKRIVEEDESDTESKDITEAEKKFKQLANDEEVARK